jgi:uncharacterized membrane protein YphA (DoxX/SURF4 family)
MRRTFSVVIDRVKYMATITIIRWHHLAAIAVGGGCLGVFPALSHAHVKWFSEPVAEPAPALPDSTTVVVLCVLVAVGTLLAKAVDLLSRAYSLTPRCLCSRSTGPLRLVYYLIAGYFLGAALTGTFLVPHLHVAEPLLTLGVAAQLVVYSALLLERGRALCASLIVMLFVIAGLHDPLFVMEYPVLLGLAWVVLFADKTPTPLGIFLVRCLLGASLISLAFTEKLHNPARAIALLDHYSLNFMSELGLAYSDRLFVYSAGVVELLIGVVFLSGWVTRLTIGVLFAFMVATNSYFFWIGEYRMAMIELVGHLPIFACGILLLFYHPVSEKTGASVSHPGAPARASEAPGRPR